MARVLLRGLASGDGSERVVGIDLEVADGGTVAFLCEASGPLHRLVRALAGLEPIRAGCLRLDDRDATDVPVERRAVAVVFPGGALFPDLDVRGNLELGLRLRGAGRPEREAKVVEVAALFGFEARLGLRPRQLTVADRVRVACARALARDPALVLFDDPFEDVEPSLRGALRVDVVRALRKTGRTALFMTCSASEAFALGERTAVVHAGRVAQVGTPDDLTREPRTRVVASLTGAAVLELPAEDRQVSVGSALLLLPAERSLVAVAFPADALSHQRSEGLAFRGQVELVEPAPPAEVVATVRLQSQVLVLRFARADAPRLGDEVVLRADPARALFFDVVTGRRLEPEPPVVGEPVAPPAEAPQPEVPVAGATVEEAGAPEAAPLEAAAEAPPVVLAVHEAPATATKAEEPAAQAEVEAKSEEPAPVEATPAKAAGAEAEGADGAEPPVDGAPRSRDEAA